MIVAGFGFRKNAPLASLHAALTLIPTPQALATAEDKAPALQPLATALNLPLIALTKAEIARNPRPGSPRVAALYATGSLAESAALAAAGPGATLTHPRQTTPDGMVVVALATGPT